MDKIRELIGKGWVSRTELREDTFHAICLAKNRLRLVQNEGIVTYLKNENGHMYLKFEKAKEK